MGIRRSGQLSYRCIPSNTFALSNKHLGGFEPPASGLAVRRSGQLSYRCICFSHDLAQPRGPAVGGDVARHRESRSPAPAAPCPGGSPRGLRCSFTQTRVVKNEKAPCLPGPSSGRQGACVPAPGAGRGCKSPTPDHLPWSIRNPDRRTVNRATAAWHPHDRFAARRGRLRPPDTRWPSLACSARAPACACG
jgi:hypothetical protein